MKHNKPGFTNINLHYLDSTVGKQHKLVISTNHYKRAIQCDWIYYRANCTLRKQSINGDV
eukprot:241447-Amphidinium_carterae.2